MRMIHVVRRILYSFRWILFTPEASTLFYFKMSEDVLKTEKKSVDIMKSEKISVSVFMVYSFIAYF